MILAGVIGALVVVGSDGCPAEDALILMAIEDQGWFRRCYKRSQGQLVRRHDLSRLMIGCGLYLQEHNTLNTATANWDKHPFTECDHQDPKDAASSSTVP